MTERTTKVLLVDDEVGILETLQILFKSEGYEVTTALGGSAGIEAIEEARPDIVVSDIRMPGSTGLDLLNSAREIDPEIAVILMTAQASLQSVMRAVNEGAYHYIQKPFSNDELLAICRRAAEARALRVENRELRKEIKRRGDDRSERPVGQSQRFTDVLDLADTVAPTDSTVLITGESGTGKEVVAQYIHARSSRSEAPFLSVNCGALPEGLLESELFGHVKGSFTGAIRDKDGLLVAALRRDLLSGRDRGDLAQDPGEAPEGDPGAGGNSRRRNPDHSGRCSNHRGHQSGSGRADPRWGIPK